MKTNFIGLSGIENTILEYCSLKPRFLIFSFSLILFKYHTKYLRLSSLHPELRFSIRSGSD